MMWVGGFLEDEGSSPVNSAMVNGLQRGKWSPYDLLGSLHHSLQTFAVPHCSAGIPHSDVAGQNALNNTAVEISEDLS